MILMLPRNPIPRHFMSLRHNYVRNILRNSRILDIGCNRYKITSNAFGLDLALGVSADVRASCLYLPFAPLSFDTVTALEIIEHLDSENQTRFLEEIYRVLRPRGQLIVSTPNISEATRGVHDLLFYVSHMVYAKKDVGTHIGELTHSQLKRALKKTGFRVISDKAFSIFNYVVEAEKS